MGNSLKFILTQVQRNDITQTEYLLKSIRNTTIADKGWDSNTLIHVIDAQQSVVVIPPRKNRTIQRAYDKHFTKNDILEDFFHGLIIWLFLIVSVCYGYVRPFTEPRAHTVQAYRCTRCLE